MFREMISMDTPIFLGLDEVEENRQKREGEEAFDSAGRDFLQGAKIGLGIAGLVSGMKRAIGDRQQKVLNEIIKNNAYSPFAGQVSEIMNQMKPAWWTARANRHPAEIATELVGYAMERLRRAERRREREEEGHRETSREKRPTPEEVMKTGWLNVPADERQMNVLSKTVLYFCGLEKMPPRTFPPVRIKEWENLSPSTFREYSKTIRQTQRELKEMGARTAWDIAIYLAGKAQTGSRSKYNIHRACVLQMAVVNEDKRLTSVIRSMPPYKELCDILGVQPTPRVGEITRARRKKKDAQTWEKLLDSCSERYRDVFQLIRATGCRVGEVASIKLARGEDESIVVTIATSKVGSRNPKKKYSPTREITFGTGTEDYEFLSRLLDRYGETPAEDMTADKIQSAWRRARKRTGIDEEGQAWCLHSFRHAYANKRKTEISREMAEEHGPRWRQKLYGEDWQRDPEKYKRYYHTTFGQLAQELGHTCEEMTKMYG